MARRHDEMLDVELFEEPEDGARPPVERSRHGGRDPTPVERREARARRLRAAAVAVAATALVLASLTLRETEVARQDDVLVAAAAGSPPLVPTLRTPLQERWRAPVGARVVGDLTLGPEPYQGAVRTVAREVATGTLRWVMSRSLTPGNQAPLCRSLGSDRATLACELPGRPGIEAANTDEALGSTPGRLVTLTSADGDTVDLAVLPVGTVGWGVTEGDLVTARVVNGSLVVERIDQASREQQWIGTVPLPTGVLARQLTLRVADGFVLVEGAAGVVVDGATGDLLTSSSATGEDGAVRLASDRLGFTVWEGPTGTWHDRQGRVGARLDGEPVEVAVDDGSGGTLVLVRNGRSIVGVDAVDAVPAWNRGPIDRVLLRLDDVVLVEGGGRLRAVDALSGASRWTATAAPGAPGSVVVSDGLRVLAVVPGEGDAPPRMTAFDLADGDAVWSAPMPTGTMWLSAEDGTVVATGEDAVVILGRARTGTRWTARGLDGARMAVMTTETATRPEPRRPGRVTG